MKLKIKNKTQPIFNWVIFLLVSTIFINNVWSQNSIDINIEHQQDTILKSEAQRDWQYLDYMKNVFSTAEQYKKFLNLNAFEVLKFQSKRKLNLSRLAKDFMIKYPNDPHFEEALFLFYSVYFMPSFIPEKIEDDHTQFFSKFPRNSSPKEWEQVHRALPVDKAAKEKWLNYGNDLATEILASDASLYRKGAVSIKLKNRDFQLALECYKALSKATLEADYWDYFDTYYWRAIKQDFYSLMNSYPDFEDGLIAYIPSVLNLLKKEVSPKLARSYMEELYINTGNSHPLSDRAGIKALHQVLGKNLKALDAIKDSKTNSVEMVFTAMDGTEVDLTKKHGKVVLLDFWSVSCPPCIKEMPHVKAMYDKYRDQGFEVLGIVAEGDNAKNMVLKIMEKTGVNWPQRLDKGKNASVSFHALYNIKSLPTVWLLDKNGVIVDRNARGTRLEPLIRKYLGLDDPDK